MAATSELTGIYEREHNIQINCVACSFSIKYATLGCGGEKEGTMVLLNWSIFPVREMGSRKLPATDSISVEILPSFVKSMALYEAQTLARRFVCRSGVVSPDTQCGHSSKRPYYRKFDVKVRGGTHPWKQISR